MKTVIGVAAFGTFAALALMSLSALAQVPEQAQASALAVPGEEARKPYTSAILVTQCKQAVAAVLVDRQGNLHPLHMKDSTQAILLTQLSQAETVTEIEVACPDTKST